MSWPLLALAGLPEVGWAVGLKYTEGFGLGPGDTALLHLSSASPPIFSRNSRCH